MPKDSDSALDMVAVKVLAFWPDSAEAWFAQTEAQFALKGVNVSSTVSFITASLPSDKKQQIKFMISSNLLWLMNHTRS